MWPLASGKTYSEIPMRFNTRHPGKVYNFVSSFQVNNNTNLSRNGVKNIFDPSPMVPGKISFIDLERRYKVNVYNL